MKVAVFSDIHGHLGALEAVLEALEKESFDHIVCAGDIVNPLAGSREVWDRLRSLQIPLLRGNHEDYLVYCTEQPARDPFRAGAQFQPVRVVAELFSAEEIRTMGELPFSMTIPGPRGQDLYICHASPVANNRSYMMVFDDEMKAALRARPEKVIVSGHIHEPWTREWEDKLLIVNGSVGLPMQSKHEAQYLVLEFRNNAWKVDHRTVPFAPDWSLKNFTESGFFARGGPVSWMLYDEFWVAQRRMAPLLRRLAREGIHPPSNEAWAIICQQELERLGRWDAMRTVIDQQ
ncbi:MAG: metallophosphoesterase family protein [Bdellovibrionales bacterium]|nr:metallophosphoesterase family protein [Bdellovibrionales bacterium]